MNYSFAILKKKNMIVMTLMLFLVIVFLIFMMNFYRRISMTDPQTSLKNYRWFVKHTELFVEKCKNHSGFIFSVALIDIVNFRRFNNMSISLGDNVLEKFAKELDSFFENKNNTVIRYRLGDEFAIIFNMKNQEEAIQMLRNFTLHLNEIKFENSFNNEPEKVSIRYFVSQFAKNDDYQSFIKRLEEGLVSQKTN